MKSSPKQIISAYFSRWWAPAFVYFLLLGVLTFTAKLHSKPGFIAANILLVVVGVAFLGVFGASIWNFARKRWVKGLLNLLFLPVCAVAGFFSFCLLMFGPSEDHFADNLKIPPNIEAPEPTKVEAQPGGEEDTFQAAVLAALQAPGGKDPAVRGNISSLVQLQKTAPHLLRRYLSTNPAWRVFEERGNLFATRRWMIGPEWKFTLHGYYTRLAAETGSKAGMADFQLRFTIGLSGKPWAANKGTTWLKAGEMAPAKLSAGNQMQESHCVISGDLLVVEVFEQSDAIERRLTKAALNFAEAEFGALLLQPTWETARKILPGQSIQIAKPSLELRNSFQPGLYDSMVRVNPGEPGMLYLKAFEVTKQKPLSAAQLKEDSSEWIGWSKDPGEVFFSNSPITIDEGDWGKPYAARFEVWFVPDSGAAERKLLEKVFKIEGWQR